MAFYGRQGARGRAQPAMEQAAWGNDGTLPPNWEEYRDEHGLAYFVDHNTERTSWVDPRDIFIKPLTFEECRHASELPLGWEFAVDPEVGPYFIDHNTWTTQLEDPRNNRLPAQQRDLGNLLTTARGTVRGQEQDLREAELAVRRAEQRLDLLIAQLSQRRPAHAAPGLRRNIELATEALNQAQRRLERLVEGLQNDKQGIRVLEDLGARMNATAARPPTRASPVLQQGRQRDEVEGLRKDILTLQLQNKHQRETDALQRQISMLQREREHDRENTHLEAQLAQTMREIDEQNKERDGDLQALVELHEEEQAELERTTHHVTNLVKSQSAQTRELLRELGNVRARTDQLGSDRDREAQLVNELLENGLDLSVLENYVSKARLAEHIAKIEENREREKEELWRELEATADVFMPKTKLQEILNSHAAQLDELRRMLRRPSEPLPSKRVWNDDLQTFEERSDDGLGDDLRSNHSGAGAGARGSGSYEPAQAPHSPRTPAAAPDSPASVSRQLTARRPRAPAVPIERRAPAPLPPTPRLRPADRGSGGERGSRLPSATSRLPPATPSPGTLRGGERAVDSPGSPPQDRIPTPRSSPRTLPTPGARGTNEPEIYHHHRRGYDPHKETRTSLGRARNFTVSPPLGLQQPGADHGEFLPGEEWMLNNDMRDLLDVHATEQAPDVRREAQGRVMELRLASKSRGHRLNFRDKVALFSTANVDVHDDIASDYLAKDKRTLYLDTSGASEADA